MAACHRSSLSTILTDLILALGIVFTLTSLTCRDLVLLKATPISALRQDHPSFLECNGWYSEFKEDLHRYYSLNHFLAADILCLGKMAKDEDARVLDGLWLGLSKSSPQMLSSQWKCYGNIPVLGQGLIFM